MANTEARKSFLDLLRIIACFFVIVNHTNSTIFLHSTPRDPAWFISLTYFFVSKIAVPVFFMISGYLLLGRTEDYKKTLQRIIRIVAALLGCALLYGVYYTLVGDEPSLGKFLERVRDVYFKSPTNALWYLYAYIGILLMLPFLQKMTALMKKRDYHVFFVLSGLCFSVLPIVSHYFPRVRLHSSFQLPLFGGYVCMLLIGQYFARFPMKKTKKGFASAAVVLIASIAFNVIATYFEYKQSAADYLFFDNRVFLPILLQSVCVFYMVSFVHLSEKASAAVSFVGACTFGIYLISDLNISLLRPLYTALCGGMHPLFAVLIFEICVFAVGLLAVAILKRIPGIQKILS